jgi:uncharacterized Zn finger protein
MGWWRRRDYFYREFYPRSRPRAAKGGIKGQSKRGDFGQSWWAKRWIAVLESFQIGARLQRGRSYARGGQVLSIEVNKGEVEARVQGSRPSPYDVNIQVKVLSAADWKTVVKELAGQALFAAKLLAGEMPQDIEKVFLDAELSLFPKKLGDLKTSCSCPDYSNPCKHIAAVYYLLGEEFDRDPFLLFRLRGLSREELVAKLQQTAQPAPSPEAAPTQEAEAPAPAEPLPVEPGAFWSMGPLPDDLYGDVQVPPASAALPKRLGNFPFWRGGERFLEALEKPYRHASQQGLAAFLGERIA